MSKIGETVDVVPFTPDYKPIRVELVDAALKYECPYSGETKILIIRRGLYVSSMSNNLLPPFMLREAGITINEVPEIHVSSLNYVPRNQFSNSFVIVCTFSYFPTSKPSTKDLEEPDDMF